MTLDECTRIFDELRDLDVRLGRLRGAVGERSAAGYAAASKMYSADRASYRDGGCSAAEAVAKSGLAGNVRCVSEGRAEVPGDTVLRARGAVLDSLCATISALVGMFWEGGAYWGRHTLLRLRME